MIQMTRRMKIIKEVYLAVNGQKAIGSNSKNKECKMKLHSLLKIVCKIVRIA
jgi:hypothetical protein